MVGDGGGVCLLSKPKIDVVSGQPLMFPDLSSSSTICFDAKKGANKLKASGYGECELPVRSFIGIRKTCLKRTNRFLGVDILNIGLCKSLKIKWISLYFKGILGRVI